MKKPYSFMFQFMVVVATLTFGMLAYGETEPNNTIANANAVGLNESVDGSLNSIDSTDTVDCYKFTTTGDGLFQLGVVPTSELNIEIILKDTDGMYELGYKNDGGNGSTEAIVYPNLRAGTYYVIVKIPDAISPVQGTYSATFNFLPVEEIDAEPNDVTTQAVEMPVNGETTGHIGYYGSAFTDIWDFYKIVLPGDGKLELTVYPDGTANVALGLYDSLNFKNLIWMDQKGKGESEKIVHSNLLAGTYIVLVDRREGYGSYNLTSLFTADPHPKNEPNDTAATAMAVNLTDSAPSATVQGRLGYYGNQYQDDNDYYKVTIPSYGQFSMTFKMDAGEGLGAGYEIWDSSLRYLGATASPDNLAAGTYYVRMYRSGGYGSYSLTIAHTPKTPPEPVSVSAGELPLNGQIDNIPISHPENTEQWYNVTLPEDGSLTVTMQFPNTVYVYMSLMYGNGTATYKDTYAYWTNDPRSVNVPNLRKGTYKVHVWRADGSGVGSLKTEFVPVTKLDAESNDEYTSLTPIAYNQTYVGHLGYTGNGWMDTLDLYLLEIPEDGSLSVTATFEKTAYHYLTVFNQDGNNYRNIGQTYGYWTADPRTVAKPNILAGKYLIQISRADGYGSYDLDVSFTPNRSNDPEWNGDDYTQPKEIALGEGYVGHLGYDSNMLMDYNDYYKVVLPQDGSFYATFQTDKTAFTYWRIYYSDFRTIVQETYSYWTTDPRTIGSTQLRAGTYYIGVNRADGYGAYEFFTEFTPQPFIDTDANHFAAQAQTIALNDIQMGSLGYTDRYFRNTVDWYRVDVPAKDKYKITFHSVNTAYFYCELYAANMVSRISSDYRYWNSNLFERELELDAGTYYIKCSRADGYGMYAVSLSALGQVVAGNLTGKVVTASNFPLAEITVNLLERSVKTDAMGTYKIEGLPPGDFNISFTSGTKYYPETAKVKLMAGQTVTLDMTMVDSNKTAPKDVAQFHGIPGNQYIHFFWSASVSPDVADGGGYKLYIDNAEPLVLGNALQYRNLGFANGAAHTCRLTVYDKYGNESAGKTLVITPSGEIVIPTPTPTLQPGQPTHTPTQPGQPTPTPTMTPQPTPTRPADQPTPTPGEIPPTPTPGQSVPVEPYMVYEFDQTTLADGGWSEIPGGFGGATPGVVIEYYGFPADKFPSSVDNRGIAVAVKSGEVTFLKTNQAIDTGGFPALIRCTVKSTAPNASIAVGALKGSLTTGENLDGTIGYSHVLSAASYVEKEGRITTIFRPDAGTIINPFVQVAGLAGGAVTVWIDRVDVFILQPGMVYPGGLFGDINLNSGLFFLKTR